MKNEGKKGYFLMCLLHGSVKGQVRLEVAQRRAQDNAAGSKRRAGKAGEDGEQDLFWCW